MHLRNLAGPQGGDPQRDTRNLHRRIRSVPEGKRYRLKALVIPTLQQFPQSFPESKLTEAMEYVNFQFKVQVGEWEEIA